MRSISDRKEVTKKIIVAAKEAFEQKGINAVKMDDIAAMLFMSKRTLYEQFTNKETLLLECIKADMASDCAYMEQVVKESTNVLEVIMRFYERSITKLRSTNQLFFQDLRKYPKVYEFLESSRENNRNARTQFFEKGIEQGLFRDDINYDLMQLLTHEQMNVLRDKSKWGEFQPIEIYNSIILVFMRGIATPKGLEIIDAYVNELKEKNKNHEVKK